MSASSHTAYRRRGVAYATACALVVSVLACALPVLALPVPLAAQNPSRAGQDVSLIVAGRIVDDSGRAIPYAGVAAKGSPRSVRADADGRFRLAGLEAGVTVQDVHSVDAGGAREKDLFAADVRAVFGVTYNMRSLPLSLDYTGSVTGPMRLPSYDEPFARPERSPAYSVHNAQATLTLGAGAALYLSVKNVFDFTQPSPLVDPANPFGDAFDTAYVYGPVRGRHAMLGLRYGASR